MHPNTESRARAPAFPSSLRRAVLVIALWSGLGIAMALALPATPAGTSGPATGMTLVSRPASRGQTRALPPFNRMNGF